MDNSNNSKRSGSAPAQQNSKLKKKKRTWKFWLTLTSIIIISIPLLALGTFAAIYYLKPAMPTNLATKGADSGEPIFTVSDNSGFIDSNYSNGYEKLIIKNKDNHVRKLLGMNSDRSLVASVTQDISYGKIHTKGSLEVHDAKTGEIKSTTDNVHTCSFVAPDNSVLCSIIDHEHKQKIIQRISIDSGAKIGKPIPMSDITKNTSSQGQLLSNAETAFMDEIKLKSRKSVLLTVQEMSKVHHFVFVSILDPDGSISSSESIAVTSKANQLGCSIISDDKYLMCIDVGQPKSSMIIYDFDGKSIKIMEIPEYLDSEMAVISTDGLIIDKKKDLSKGISISDSKEPDPKGTEVIDGRGELGDTAIRRIAIAPRLSTDNSGGNVVYGPSSSVTTKDKDNYDSLIINSRGVVVGEETGPVIGRGGNIIKSFLSGKTFNGKPQFISLDGKTIVVEGSGGRLKPMKIMDMMTGKLVSEIAPTHDNNIVNLSIVKNILYADNYETDNKTNGYVVYIPKTDK